MHRALLIDEIVQEIFEICYEKGYKRTLAQLARCCKAWKIPALEKTWRKLPCISPLIRLASSPAGYLNPDIVYEYARNVKHIQIRANNQDFDLLNMFLDKTVDPTGSHHFLPNVACVEIAREGCLNQAIYLALTPALRCIDIDIGIIRTQIYGLQASQTRFTSIDRSNRITNYLTDASRKCNMLETLRMRGFAYEPSNAGIGGLTGLRVLSLKMGLSLDSITLAKVASFPVLEELTVHADMVDPDEFEANAVTLPSEQTVSFFPSLRVLQIRSQLALVVIIVQHIQSKAFNDLETEVIDAQDDPSTWLQFFSAIPRHATTLERLRIDHHVRFGVPDHNGQVIDNIPGPIIQNEADDGTSNTPFSANTLSPLSEVFNLRSFTIDTNLPPGFDDKDMNEMARWWPHLHNLDLNFFYSDDVGEDESLVKWKPRTTLACLDSVARLCGELRHLTLPLDVNREFNSNQAPLASSHKLRELMIVTPYMTLVESTKAYIHGLFPVAIEHDDVNFLILV